MSCACREVDCMYLDSGYPWCTPCGEHHRPPQCPIDQLGRSLAPCGCPWDNLDQSSLVCATHLKGVGVS